MDLLGPYCVPHPTRTYFYVHKIAGTFIGAFAIYKQKEKLPSGINEQPIIMGIICILTAAHDERV